MNLMEQQQQHAIGRLVQRVQANASRWGALFGVVYELAGDGQTFRPIGKVLGTSRDIVLADSYMNVIFEQSLESIATGKNRTICIKGPTEALPHTRGPWHLCVIIEKLPAPACVALVVEVPKDAQASEQLHQLAHHLEASLDAASSQVPSAQAESGQASQAAGDLQIKSIFKTCLKYSTHALLVADQPGFLVQAGGLRQTKSLPLSQDSLIKLIQEVLPQGTRQMEIPGVMQWDLPFESRGIFRLAVLGQPAPRAMAITLLAKDAPPLAMNTEAWSQFHMQPEGNWLDQFQQSLAGPDRHALLIEHSPPLIWSNSGIEAPHAKILSSLDIRKNVGSGMKLDRTILNPSGYMEYGIALAGGAFSAYLFDYFQSPINVLVKRPPAASARQ